MIRPKIKIRKWNGKTGKCPMCFNLENCMFPRSPKYYDFIATQCEDFVMSLSVEDADIILLDGYTIYVR